MVDGNVLFQLQAFRRDDEIVAAVHRFDGAVNVDGGVDVVIHPAV